MTPTVEAIIRNTVQMDPSITQAMLDLALDALKGTDLVRATPYGDPCEEDELPMVVKRKEVARKLQIKLNAVDHMARIGVLVKVFGSGEQRGIGYTRESVRAALKGREQGRRHGKRRRGKRHAK